MTYTIYRWVAVPLLTAFLLLLPTLTKPRSKSNKPKNSAQWLTIQMIMAGLCAAVFGLLTIVEFWTNLTRKETSDWHISLVESTPVGVIFFVALVISDVTVPILFALSIRWIRTCAVRRSITSTD
jgi:hypothetical protein